MENKDIHRASKNRWFIALSAIGVHASIGSVYAFSVFKKPLGRLLGDASDNEIAWTFSLAIFFLGISAAIMGHFVEKHGPRVSGCLAALFFGGGLLVAGLGAALENIYVIWLGYGVLGGVGLGIGYITPVSTLVKWFPDRRGLATGLAIMGFGFGAFFGGPLFQKLMTHFGLLALGANSLAEAANVGEIASQVAGLGGPPRSRPLPPLWRPRGFPLTGTLWEGSIYW